ncbi:MAG TPA: hypothetical protein VNQ74_05125 [Burkholderiaceae bacterium]|nr:hypothetical protein [Burkholderiaceae bacterium]
MSNQASFMADLIVKPVQSRRERREFLLLPWQIYRDDPNWIPPLLANQKELLGYKHHPFYDDAEIQTFLAYRGGRACGRIAAIVNRGHNRRYQDHVGFFGFFECTDDQQIASALFDTARAWLSERGLKQMRGPVNPSLNYECGLLVEGFDTPPFFMMTHNWPYYGRLIEGYGFQKVQDLFAFWGHINMLGTLDKKLDFVVEEATKRFGVKIRPLDTSRFVEEVRMFLDIYNQSLQATWGFVPLSEGEIKHLAKGMRHLIVPELTSIGEVEGRPIGVVFALLDYNQRIKEINGRLFPFGFLKLLSKRRELKRARVVSANVVPEYQRWGIGLVVLRGIVPSVLDWGVQEVEFSWVLESNHLSRRTLERGGAKVSKLYRLYDYDFPS